jgi:speckle-type POZ protein
MTSEFFGTPKMIVPYEWNFESVEEEEPMTIASKLILFRGEKVFRAGLKNHTLKPVLFFMVIDLRKFGMKVESVTYGIQGIGLGPATMTQMTKHDLGEEGNLQLFTMTFLKKLVGKRTYVFRICIEGADPGYSYQLSDRLAKDQLWDALKSQQNLADLEFVVKDKTFPAHRAILAARSQMFADEFENKQMVKGDPHQIRIDGVEPSTVENFLHFIYTGEPIGTLADEELLKLADHYQLKILTSLCKVALKKMDSMEMANLRKRLNSNPEELYSSKIM